MADAAQTADVQPSTTGSGSRLRIISRGGVPVDSTSQATPSPEPPSPAHPVEPDTPTEPAEPQPDPGAAGGQEPADASQEAGQQSEPQPQPDIFAQLAERTEGLIKAPDDVYAILEQNRQLQQQLAEKEKEPLKFPNERAKKLYEYSLKFPDKELEAARTALHVLSLDLKSLSPKEAQFEAFVIENPTLTRDEARRFFEAKYNKQFGEEILEDDLTAQYDHKVQTEKALKTLSDLQEQLDAPSQPSQQAGQQQVAPEEVERINRKVQDAMQQFGGVKYQFFDDDPDSVVNFPLEDAEAQRFQAYAMDPDTFFKDFLEGCCDPDTGEFDHNTYIMKLFEIVYADKMRETAFTQGVKLGELRKIKELKNTSTSREPTATGGAAPQRPKTFADAWLAAVKQQGAR